MNTGELREIAKILIAEHLSEVINGKLAGIDEKLTEIVNRSYDKNRKLTEEEKEDAKHLAVGIAKRLLTVL